MASEELAADSEAVSCWWASLEEMVEARESQVGCLLLTRWLRTSRTMSALLGLANLDLASTPGAAPKPASASTRPTLPPVIPTAQRARSINGQQTDVLVQLFADRVIVVVTQMGRIGCMVRCRLVNSPRPSY